MTVNSDYDLDFSEATGLPLIGRGRELVRLVAAMKHPPAVVFLEGEGGIGKSRLVREASAVIRAESGRVLTGACHPLREPLPFGPVVDALREVGPWLPAAEEIPPTAGALVPWLPDLADQLPSPPGASGEPHLRRHRIVQAVRTVLDSVSPVTLVVEDLHWADDATRELLLLLARDLPSEVVLLLTYRHDDLPAGTPVLGAAFRRPAGTAGAEISLSPLSEADLRELVSVVMGVEAGLNVAHTLYERSAGLPLVVEEDLLTLRGHRRKDWAGERRRPRHAPSTDSSQGAGEDGARARLEKAGIPRGLREALAERVFALSTGAVALVEAAAVLAVTAGESLLAEAAELSPFEGSEALMEAVAASVLRENGPNQYGFRHSLDRLAVYQDIPGPRRRQLHRRALQVLWAQPSPPLVQIAHHTRATGDVQAWLHYAQAAADQAVAVDDRGTATSLLRSILAEPSVQADQRSRAAVALARIALHSDDYTKTVTALRRILAEPGLHAAAQGEVRLTLGLLVMDQGGDATGDREIENAIPELESRPELAARAMAAMALTDGTGRSAAEQWSWMERAEATIAHSGDRAARAAVTACRLSLRARFGDPDVQSLLDQLPREAQDPEIVRQTARALVNAARSAALVGLDDRAAELADEALDLAQRYQTPLHACFARYTRLGLTWLEGEWADWESRFAAFRADHPDIPAKDPDAAVILGITEASQGHWTRATELFGQVLAREGGSGYNLDAAAAGMARIHLARDDPNSAWTTVVPILDRLHHKETWVHALGLVPAAVEAAMRCGDSATANELAHEHARGIQGRQAPAADAEHRICCGLLEQEADPTASYEHFEHARLIWLGIGRPYHAATAGELAARAFSIDHPPAEVAARLRDVAEVFERLGASSDAARCQHLIRELGQTRPPPRGRRGYGDQLSPREQQVAELLRHGAGNAEIAQALFLSTRTVEHHVAHVLKKLGVTRDALK